MKSISLKGRNSVHSEQDTFGSSDVRTGVQRSTWQINAVAVVKNTFCETLSGDASANDAINQKGINSRGLGSSF